MSYQNDCEHPNDLSRGKEIKEICLQLLTRREHSQQELIDKLSLKGFKTGESQIVVDELAKQGWQSNQRFAESFARYRIKKGFGPIKIAYELNLRGIKQFDFNSVIFELAEDWLEVLEQVYLTKFDDEPMLKPKELQKRSRFLLQRGFSSEQITQFFKRLAIKTVY